MYWSKEDFILLILYILMASSGSCACLGFIVLNSPNFQVSQLLGLSEWAQITEKSALIKPRILNVLITGHKTKQKKVKDTRYVFCYALTSLCHLNNTYLKIQATFSTYSMIQLCKWKLITEVGLKGFWTAKYPGKFQNMTGVEWEDFSFSFLGIYFWENCFMPGGHQ